MSQLALVFAPVPRVAALFVHEGGPYWSLPRVEAYDVKRDARTYSGPWPVVAHPPCERWGRYWFGSPSSKGPRKVKGDDGGCFAAALAAVRSWGGVLEHPADSSAWAAFGLLKPSMRGWSVPDAAGGSSCRVEQGHYGHRARKPTWLYACRTNLPELVWGPAVSVVEIEQQALPERIRTPPAFRDLLLSIARSTTPPGGP